MDVSYLFVICFVAVFIIDRAIMTKIYLKNYPLAKDILRDREKQWKIRGFGWMTIYDMGALCRLNKVIILRKDPVLVKPLIWFIYVFSTAVIAIGISNMAIVFFKGLFNILSSL